MIVVPLKVSDRYDIGPPLAAWIDETYSCGGGGGGDNQRQAASEESSSSSNNQRQQQRPSSEFREDLLRLSSLRNSLTEAICHAGAHRTAADENAPSDLREYHAALLSCEERDVFPPKSERDGIPGLRIAWRCALERGGGSAGPGGGRARSDLKYERAAILFNAGAMESHLASRVPRRSEDDATSNKEALQDAFRRYRAAAGIFHHLRTEFPFPRTSREDNRSVDLSEAGLALLENLMLAQGQCIAYRVQLSKFSSPPHLVLSKLAAGAADLYASATTSAQDPMLVRRMTDSARWVAHLRAQQMLWRARAEFHESSLCHERAKKGGGRGYGVEIARLAVAEAHCEQALLFGSELVESGGDSGASSGRSAAVDGGDFGVGGAGAGGGDGSAPSIASEAERLKRKILQRKAEAEGDNERVYHESVPKARELQPIQGRCIAKVTPLEESLMPAALDRQVFSNLLSEQAKLAYGKFTEERNTVMHHCTSLAQKESENARNALARVNLPQSLTAFSSKDGLPASIWNKIDSMEVGFLEKLKGRLWDLKDTADMARNVLGEVAENLDNDVNLDREFRDAHPSYRGPDPREAQSSTRRDLKHYAGLLDNAKNGDAVLLENLEKFEAEPKFKLLSMSRDQLDKLIPSISEGTAYDTSALRSLLNELSKLLRERDGHVTKMKECKSSGNVKGELAAVTSDDSARLSFSYEEVTRRALLPFEGAQARIEENIGKQPALLDKILDENEAFMKARQTDALTLRRENIIQMIEEALMKVKTVNSQVSEGQHFYDSIMPRLSTLKQQAGDQSVKFAVDRCEFEDRESTAEDRLRQEMEDRRVAADLAKEAESGENGFGAASANPPAIPAPTSQNDHSMPPQGSGGAAPGSSPPLPIPDGTAGSDARPNVTGSDSLSTPLVEHDTTRPPLPAGRANPAARSGGSGTYTPPTLNSNSAVHSSSQPGVYSVSNYEQPPTRVDDEKVASLVAMDFDPDKVVDALARHDNNLEHALNYLLSC